MKLVIAMLALALAGSARAEEAPPSAPAGELAGSAVRPAAAEAASGGVARNPFQDGAPVGYDQLVDQNRQLRLQVEIAERQARLAELRAKTAVAEAAVRAALLPPKPIAVEAPKPAPEAPKPVVQAPMPAVPPSVPPPRLQQAQRTTGAGEGGTRLVGFVGQAGELRALVQSGGRVVAVRSGDQVGGGTVQAIEPGQVTIRHGKGRRTLTTRIGPGEIAEPHGGLVSSTAGRGASSQPVTMAGNGGMSPALMGSLGLAPAPLPSALPPVPASGR